MFSLIVFLNLILSLYSFFYSLIIPLLIKALRCAHILRPPGHLRWHMIPFWNWLLRAGDLPKTDFHLIASGKNGKRKKNAKKRRRIGIKFWV